MCDLENKSANKSLKCLLAFSLLEFKKKKIQSLLKNFCCFIAGDNICFIAHCDNISTGCCIGNESTLLFQN